MTDSWVWGAPSPADDLPATVHGRVTRWAARSPERIALSYRGRDYPYRELDLASRAIARSLVELGVTPGSVVAVAVPRSPRLVAATLGILRAGAAYMIIDDTQPPARVDVMLRAADVVVGIGDVAVRRLTLPAWQELTRNGASIAEPPEVGTAETPCSVFFTSGSSGTPKGILSPHRATVRLANPNSWFGNGAGVVILHAAALPWDGTTLELWPALMTGGRVVIAEERLSTPATLRGHVNNGVDTVFLTTSLFNQIVDVDIEAFRGLTRVLTGGERESPAHLDRLLRAHPRLRLTHAYGPAEACVFTTTHEVSPEDVTGGPVPIGRPIGETGVAVVDSGLCPVPGGEVGEIVVRGSGLALRYVGDPRLTAHRFVGSGVDRLYRTGDLGRWDERGRLVFAGRLDRQLKLRGYRIEPNEIEYQLKMAAGVVDARVVLLGASTPDAKLIAFVTVDQYDPHRLQNHVTAHLPAYMVPFRIHVVERFPLNSSGKVDDDALRALAVPP